MLLGSVLCAYVVMSNVYGLVPESWLVITLQIKIHIYLIVIQNFFFGRLAMHSHVQVCCPGNK